MSVGKRQTAMSCSLQYNWQTCSVGQWFRDKVKRLRWCAGLGELGLGQVTLQDNLKTHDKSHDLNIRCNSPASTSMICGTTRSWWWYICQPALLIYCQLVFVNSMEHLTEISKVVTQMVVINLTFLVFVLKIGGISTERWRDVKKLPG